MNSADILPHLLVDDLGMPDETRVELLIHRSERNWREQNDSAIEKIRNLRTGLKHDGPFSGELVPIGEITDQLRTLGEGINDSDVISVTSRLFDPEGTYIGHLAIMNLHTEGFESLEALIDSIYHVTGGISGYLMDSGRYYHFYGRKILSDREWLDFMINFLMPCVLVSPRYIGHSLFRGFCSVRLTSSKPYKPMVPKLLQVF
jgi:hypothetical protein